MRTNAGGRGGFVEVARTFGSSFASGPRVAVAPDRFRPGGTRSRRSRFLGADAPLYEQRWIMIAVSGLAAARVRAQTEPS